MAMIYEYIEVHPDEQHEDLSSFSESVPWVKAGIITSKNMEEARVGSECSFTLSQMVSYKFICNRISEDNYKLFMRKRIGADGVSCLVARPRELVSFSAKLLCECDKQHWMMEVTSAKTGKVIYIKVERKANLNFARLLISENTNMPLQSVQVYEFMDVNGRCNAWKKLTQTPCKKPASSIRKVRKCTK